MKYTYQSVLVTKRKRLPHWAVPNGLYMVTFRLHDSIPEWVYARLRRKHADDPSALRRAVEQYLDEGRGSCVLRRPEMAAIVVDAMQHFHRDRYLVTTWSVMPNHVHVILKLLAEHALRDVIRSLKRFTAREINTLLGREGTLWQEDYFDTLIRSEAHFLRAAEYVLGNPGVNGTNALATSEILGTAPYGHEGEWRAGL